MFDLEEHLKEFPIIIATGLLGYFWLSQHSPKGAPYVPPTKEQVVWEYQNVPLFNRTVDTIVSRLRHRLPTNAMHSDGKACPLYVDYRKSCKALQERRAELAAAL